MAKEGLTAEEQTYLERVSEFARTRVAPFAQGWERDRVFPLETFREGARLGLAGLLIPKELGGMGLSHAAAARALEELAGACYAFGFTLFVQHNVLSGIVRYGSAALVSRFATPMLKGERIGAFCLTEPGTGSDASAISTTATRQAGSWVLDGEKAWVTNGGVADLYSVYVQTDPSQGWRGIACLLVDGKTRGLERSAPYELMGAHAMSTNGVSFHHCQIDDSHLLIAPGDAFKGAMAGINRARMVIAAMCCGMLKVCLKTAVQYASERRAFGRSIKEFQGLQFELAEVATRLEAARALAYRAASLLDAGEPAIMEAAHAKKFATQVAFSGISTCMRAMGANGFRSDYPFGRHLANAQMSQYLDGTDEIQNTIIGRGLFDAPTRTSH